MYSNRNQLLFFCILVLCLISLCFSQNLPVLTVNAPQINGTVVAEGTTAVVTGSFYYDARTPNLIRQHTHAIINIPGSPTQVGDTWSFTDSKTYATEVSLVQGQACMNNTVTSTDPSWPVCTAWQNQPDGAKYQVCKLTVSGTPAEVDTTVYITGGLITRIKSVETFAGTEVGNEDLMLINPSGSPPPAEQFSIPASCMKYTPTQKRSFGFLNLRGLFQ